MTRDDDVDRVNEVLTGCTELLDQLEKLLPGVVAGDEQATNEAHVISMKLSGRLGIANMRLADIVLGEI